MKQTKSERSIIGSGEMAILIRNYPWDQTPLGPIRDWSDLLLCSVNMMLACAFPALIFWGPEMIQLYNERAIPLIGKKHSVILGREGRWCWAEAWPIIGDELASVLARGETVFHESVNVPIVRDGKLQDVYWNYGYSPIFEADGTVAGILDISQDVTGELFAVRALRASEERASRILQSIGDAVIVTDTNTLVTSMNAIAESLTGWSLAEAVGRPLRDVFHIVDENTRAPVESPADKVKEHGSIVGLSNHTVLVRPDGSETPIDDSSAPIRDRDGNLTGIVLVFRSVAERRQAARSLQQSEERLRMALAAAQGVGTYDWDVSRDRVFSDSRFASMYGVDPAQAVTGASIAHFFRNIHPDDRKRVEGLIQQTLKEGNDFACEYRLIQTDRSVRWVSAVGRCSYAANGTPLRFAGVAIDITDRKQTEDALRESEARFQAIYSASLQYIGILSPEGKILDCNRASLAFAGSTREDVVGKSFEDSPWFAYTEGAPEMIRQAIGRVAAGEALVTQLSLNRPSGETVPFDFSMTPVFGPKGEVIFIVPEGRDISGLKRTELALVQSEKLAAVGRLASSIAHEINNPLEAVTNLLYLARQRAALPEVQEYLKSADHELRRVSAIANQTLRFHKQASKPQAIRAEELFATVLSIYEGRLKNAKISIEISHRAKEPLVCFEGDIRQVLNNLVGNAIDAMSTGGRLLIRSHNATDWKTRRRGTVLTVADTGCGMSPEVRKQIFDPFFTTKGFGGTGLGLWVSQQVAERHGGLLSVRSNADPSRSGSVFRFFLPFA